MKLEDESTNLCTFNTPIWEIQIFKFSKISDIGISSAAEIYRRTINFLIAGAAEYFYKTQDNGNSENKHFEFNLAFDYILVIIRNDASYITVILISEEYNVIGYKI